MTLLTPMPQSTFSAYRDASAKGYAEDNVAAGRWPADGALQRSYEEFDGLLPNGLETPDHHLYQIRESAMNRAVGILWCAIVEKNGIRTAFVYDVEIQAEFRRCGHARGAFAALELLVKSWGLSRIGLHVFGHNAAAQGLYRSLGYEVTGINMLKQLETGDV